MKVQVIKDIKMKKDNKLQNMLFTYMMVMTFSIGAAIYMQSLALDYFSKDSSMSMSCTKLAYFATGLSFAGFIMFVRTAIKIERLR